MRRRELFKHGTATVGVAVTMGLAGCGGESGTVATDDGGSGGTGTDRDDSDSTATTRDSTETAADADDTATSNPTCENASGEPTGEVIENPLTGLEITDFSAQVNDTFGTTAFEATVTVENVGDQPTTMEYNIDIITYDASGNQLNQGLTTIQATSDQEYAPGESYTFEGLDPQIDCPAAVARYEIELNCDGSGTDGAYCN